MGIFSKRDRQPPPPPPPPVFERPVIDINYYRSILVPLRVPETAANLENLAERTALAFALQGSAYMGQALDRSAFARFVADFSAPSVDALAAPDQVVSWLWAWDSRCHGALVAQASKWARECAEPGGFITPGGNVEPWNDGSNQSLADDREIWQMVFERNAGQT